MSFQFPVHPRTWSCCEIVPAKSSSFPGNTQTIQTITWLRQWTLRYCALDYICFIILNAKDQYYSPVGTLNMKLLPPTISGAHLLECL